MELAGAATHDERDPQEECTLRFLVLAGVIAALVAGTALFASNQPAGGAMASATPVVLVHNTSMGEN